MKLIDSKYLVLLLVFLLVLFLSFAYMSYGVVVGKVAPKTPSEIIDSLQIELRLKEKEIRLLEAELSKRRGLRSNGLKESAPSNQVESPVQKKSSNEKSPARFEGF